MAQREISPAKARKILEHGEIEGVPLTKKQRGFFGIIAGGKTPMKAKRRVKVVGRSK